MKVAMKWALIYFGVMSAHLKIRTFFFLIAANLAVERSGLTKSFKGMDILQASLLKQKLQQGNL